MLCSQPKTWFDVLRAETKAEIVGDTAERLVKAGSTLKLACKVYLGEMGPDKEYTDTAVIHWFHDQRLLDADLATWRTLPGLAPSSDLRGLRKLSIRTEVDSTGIKGWLVVRRTTHYDAGNYTCVPSYAIPDWVQVHVIHGMFRVQLGGA